MSAAALIERAASSGVTIRLDGDRLKINGPRETCDVLLPEIREHKSVIVAYLREAGDEVPDDARHMSAAEFEKLRTEVVWLITELFVLERWSTSFLDGALDDAMAGSLASLMPNLEYFRERVAGVHAEIIARELAAARSYLITAEALARRRGCHPTCDATKCVGKRLRCSRDGIEPPTVLN
jgi:hypothetical protein